MNSLGISKGKKKDVLKNNNNNSIDGTKQLGPLGFVKTKVSQPRSKEDCDTRESTCFFPYLLLRAHTIKYHSRRKRSKTFGLRIYTPTVLTVPLRMLIALHSSLSVGIGRYTAPAESQKGYCYKCCRITVATHKTKNVREMRLGVFFPFSLFYSRPPSWHNQRAAKKKKNLPQKKTWYRYVTRDSKPCNSYI